MAKNDWRKKEFPVLSIFGVILLLIGLVASFYVETQTFGTFTVREYPYRDIGLVLTLAGIILASVGFVISRQKL